MDSLTIGKLAQRAGVGIDTVRFYERAGLIPRARRTAAGYRLYDDSDADRLRFIRRAKGLGFSLEEIAELLQLNAGRGSRATVKRIAEQRLHDLDQKIRDLSTIRQALGRLVRECSGSGPVRGCPIIDGVLGATAEHCKEQ